MKLRYDTSLHIRHNFQKPFFFKNNLIKDKKPFSKTPKGWKLSNSPYWKALELLREIS